jgi:streptogramin lyase
MLAFPLLAAQPAEAASNLTTYPTLTQFAFPDEIVKGPDGALWFTEENGANIGRIDTSGNVTEYPTPFTNSAPEGLAVGSDSALWFTELGSSNVIGRITTDGSVTTYMIPSSNSIPLHIAAGSDSALWFTESGANKIGRIDTSGSFTEYSLPNSGSIPDAIVAGPDGALWFSEDGRHYIGRIDTNGDITEYQLDPPSAFSDDINSFTVGPDGALWFAQYDKFEIGRIDMSGNITHYPLPANTGNPNYITVGSDGALWFTEEGSGNFQNIGRMTLDGAATNYAIPGSGGDQGGGVTLNGITNGPDNAIWFTELRGATIGRLAEPAAGPTNLSAPANSPAPTLTWDSVSGATSYNIYANGIQIATSPTNTYTDNSATTGTNKYYVTAVTPDGETLPSNVVTVQIQTALSITSANTATANIRTLFDFQVVTTGTPPPAITETGILPTGITLTDNTDGTADLAGTPVSGTAGTYPITIIADNGNGNPASQSFTLTITDNPSTPTFSSSTSDTETYGVPFSFTVQTNGNPVPAITKTGALPKDITFTDNGDGTATISGTPSLSTDLGVYTLNLKAKNSQGTATQTFTLTINKAPVINKIGTKTAHVNQAFTMKVVSKGFTPPELQASGLPHGLQLVDNGDGTGTIQGTPFPNGIGGSYPVTITAINATGTTSETFTLNVDDAPAITSADNANATVGSTFSFKVTATGFPTPAITKTGILPKGITFQASTDTFNGIPKAGTAGSYPITITAKNSTATMTQSFTLTVN